MCRPPEPSRGEALVKLKAASINPGEAKIREGLLQRHVAGHVPFGRGQ